MLRDQARNGLKAQLKQAVTDGNTDAADKIADQIAALDVQTTPKPIVSYGDPEVRAELGKLPWFGVDPRKTAKALQYGRDLDPKRFATAEIFAKAVSDAVDEDFKPAVEPSDEDDIDDDTGDDKDKDADKDKAKKARRRTDGPGDSNADGASGNRRSGPWTKMSDAPAAIQTEIKRAANKLLSSKATKEQREAFEKNALAGHYTIHQRSKRK